MGFLDSHDGIELPAAEFSPTFNSGQLNFAAEVRQRKIPSGEYACFITKAGADRGTGAYERLVSARAISNALFGNLIALHHLIEIEFDPKSEKN